MPDDTMIGHNSGAVDPALVDGFLTRADEFGRTAVQWGEAGVQDDEQAGRLADFLTGARGLYKEIDEARKEAKRPHDERGKAVQKAFAPLLAAVKKAGDIAKELHTGYLHEKDRKAQEAARVEREKAEAAAREAEARVKAAEEAGQAVAAEAAAQEAEEARKAAEAVQAEKAQAKSSTGAGRTVALRKRKVPMIESRRRAFMALEARHAEKFDALIKQVAAQEARAAGDQPLEIPGIRFIIEEYAA